MTPKYFKVYWPNQRRKESRGFVSKRILMVLAWEDTLLFGESFVQRFEKFNRIYSPEAVCVKCHNDKIVTDKSSDGDTTEDIERI